MPVVFHSPDSGFPPGDSLAPRQRPVDCVVSLYFVVMPTYSWPVGGLYILFIYKELSGFWRVGFLGVVSGVCWK